MDKSFGTADITPNRDCNDLAFKYIVGPRFAAVTASTRSRRPFHNIFGHGTPGHGKYQCFPPPCHMIYEWFSRLYRYDHVQL